jgi:hypothetical protein
MADSTALLSTCPLTLTKIALKFLSVAVSTRAPATFEKKGLTNYGISSDKSRYLLNINCVAQQECIICKLIQSTCLEA